MTNDSLILHKELIENLPVGIVSLNTDDSIAYMSESARKMLGIDDDEIISKEFYHYLLPEYKHTHLERMRNYINGETQTVTEYIMKRTDGSRFWAEGYALPRSFANGKVFVVNVVFRDITERKLNQLKLQESEIRLSALIESTNDIIWSVDKDNFRIITFNSSLKKYLHDMYGTKIFIGATMEQLLPAENAKNMIKLYRKALYEGEFIHEYKTKSYEQIFSMSFNTIKHDGNIFGISVFGKNITEYLEAKIMLQNEMEFNKILLQSLPVLFVVINDKNEIKVINNVFKKILGYEEDEVINKNYFNFIAEKDRKTFGKIFLSKLRNGMPIKVEQWMIKKDKEKVLIEWYISPIINEKRKINYVMAAGNDISERRINEIELENHRNKLEELVKQRTLKLEHVNKLLNDEIKRQKEVEEKVTEALKKEKELNILKSRFISIASHEFRTPLTTIYSSAQLLERYGKTWSYQLYQSQFDRIKQNINHLIELLEDILVVGKTDTGKLKSEPTDVDLIKICEDLIADVKIMLSEKHHLISKIKLPQQFYYLDEKAIKHILLNLLSNAIKYSPKGGEIGLTVYSSKKTIIFKISDKGIGIPEEEHSSVFEPFHRAKNISDIRGTGLGLAITKRFVELVKGEISFTSSLGHGTTFKVVIPVKD